MGKMTMRNIERFLLPMILLGLSGPLLAAVPPERINFQGVLRDNAGSPFTGTPAMTFRLYDTGAGCPGGGTLLLTDAHASVPVSGGLFNVALGSGTAPPGGLSAAFRDNAAVWVEIEVSTEVLCPRVRVESSAYALMSGGLNTLDDVGIGTASPSEKLEVDLGNILVQGAGSFDLTGEEATVYLGDTNHFFQSIFGQGVKIGTFGVPDGIFLQEGTGNVGIGTTTPTETLEVIGNGKFTGTLEAASADFTSDVQVGGDLLFADGTMQTTAPVPADGPCFDTGNRFVDCGNGTVTDTVTGLIWLQDASCATLPGLGGSESGNYQAANEAAAALADGLCLLTDNSSPGDWRLPTMEEWQVIMDQAFVNGCGIPGPFVPDTFGTGCCGVGACPFAGVQLNVYWSSTTLASNPVGAWGARLNSVNMST